MGKCKAKVIQTNLGIYSGIIRHIQELFRHIQAYSEPCISLAQNHNTSRTLTYLFQKHIQNPGIFTTLIYSEPWYIENAGIFKIRGILITLSTSTMKRFAKVVNGYKICITYNYFRSISLLRSLLQGLSIMTFLNTGLISTPVVLIPCKRLWHARGVGIREFLIDLLIYSNKSVYLQLITVLVQGSSPPKSHEQDYLNLQQKP